jgi:acyl-CoA reductase-like NAD-dependent aldehyde dehydrogenase
MRSLEESDPFAVVNPSTEQVVAAPYMAATLDVDLAVQSARSASRPALCSAPGEDRHSRSRAALLDN